MENLIGMNIPSKMLMEIETVVKVYRFQGKMFLASSSEAATSLISAKFNISEKFLHCCGNYVNIKMPGGGKKECRKPRKKKGIGKNW